MGYLCRGRYGSGDGLTGGLRLLIESLQDDRWVLDFAQSLTRNLRCFVLCENLQM
jgi:hypothetical protein